MKRSKALTALVFVKDYYRVQQMALGEYTVRWNRNIPMKVKLNHVYGYTT